MLSISYGYGYGPTTSDDPARSPGSTCYDTGPLSRDGSGSSGGRTSACEDSARSSQPPIFSATSLSPASNTSLFLPLPAIAPSPSLCSSSRLCCSSPVVSGIRPSLYPPAFPRSSWTRYCCGCDVYFYVSATNEAAHPEGESYLRRRSSRKYRPKGKASRGRKRRAVREEGPAADTAVVCNREVPEVPPSPVPNRSKGPAGKLPDGLPGACTPGWCEGRRH